MTMMTAMHMMLQNMLMMVVDGDGDDAHLLSAKEKKANLCSGFKSWNYGSVI